jgi:hypothetical protein
VRLGIGLESARTGHRINDLLAIAFLELWFALPQVNQPGKPSVSSNKLTAAQSVIIYSKPNGSAAAGDPLRQPGVGPRDSHEELVHAFRERRFGRHGDRIWFDRGGYFGGDYRRG